MLQPEKLLKELGEVWSTLGQEEQAGVLRACSMTLLMMIERAEDAAQMGETVAALMPEHPSRVILVRLDSSPEPVLHSRVFAQCWRPPQRKQQICSEQIEIVSSRENLEGVARLVLGLTVPDLPVVVWSRCSSLLQSPEFEPVRELASKLIVDTGGSTHAGSAIEGIRAFQARGRTIADLAWTRLTGWREAIAKLFEDPAYRAKLGQLTGCEILWAGPAVPTAAYYMAGWFSRCLGPEQSSLVRLREVGESGAPLRGVRLQAAGVDISVTLSDDSTLELSADALSTRLPFPPATDYLLLREELSILGRDPVFQETLTFAGRFAE